jgi:pilus assembly protein Flp/PilA
MLSLLKKFRKNEIGATAIEYALIAALISVAAIAAFTSVGTQIGATLTTVSDKLDDANKAASE